jgi:hypothetical protein
MYTPYRKKRPRRRLIIREGTPNNHYMAFYAYKLMEAGADIVVFVGVVVLYCVGVALKWSYCRL